mgnify:CR=1 FL=1
MLDDCGHLDDIGWNRYVHSETQKREFGTVKFYENINTRCHCVFFISLYLVVCKLGMRDIVLDYCSFSSVWPLYSKKESNDRIKEKCFYCRLNFDINDIKYPISPVSGMGFSPSLSFVAAFTDFEERNGHLACL